MNRLASPAATAALTAIRVERPSMERLVIDMLERCTIGDSLCPSDIARAAVPHDWRSAMAAVRHASCQLAALGVVRIVVQGAHGPFDGHWRGPIRLERGAAWEEVRALRSA